MQFIKKNLNYAATALILAALAVWMVQPYRKALILVLALAGLAALAAYMAVNLSALKQSFKRKAFIYSGNLVLAVVLVLGIVTLINYFSANHHHRFDFTSAKVHSLSDQTISVLKNLKTDIHFKCFFRETNYGRSSLENLLKIYAYHSGRLKYEFIDPDKNPGLVKRYNVTQDGTTIIEAGDRENMITTITEEDVTNALIKVTRDRKKVIYFLEGHGEQSIEDSGDSGYSTLKSELEKMGYEIKKQSLALSDELPAGADLLVVPGPEKDLLGKELEIIKSYIDGGGRALFMVDPETAPGMPAFLAGYGFKLENDIVVDPVSRMLGGDYFMPVITEYETHAITSKFRYATFFPLARSVAAAESKPEGIEITELAKTSPNSWSERQLNAQEVNFDEDKDRQGPVNLAAVALIKIKGAVPEEKKEGDQDDEAAGKDSGQEKEGRLAVIGDSDFLKNQYFGLSGNGNFGLNVINWLTEEADLVAIQPKTRNPRTVNMTPPQMALVRLVVLYFLPLAVFVFGIFVWIRRRSM